MKFYKIVRESGEEAIVTGVKEEDIVESLYEDGGLKEIDADTVRAYRLVPKMSKKRLDEIDIDILLYAIDVDTYVENYIVPESLKDNCLYFDSFSKVIYSKKDILRWGTERYIIENNGNGKTMSKILKEAEREEDL